MVVDPLIEVLDRMDEVNATGATDDPTATGQKWMDERHLYRMYFVHFNRDALRSALVYVFALTLCEFIANCVHGRFMIVVALAIIVVIATGAIVMITMHNHDVQLIRVSLDLLMTII